MKMSDSNKSMICALCLLLGAVAPWGLIVSAAIISVFTGSDYWAETAAWMAAFGLLLLAVSYLLMRIADMGQRPSH